MTTPASNTPFAIIEDAMRDARRLQEGDSANSEQLAKYLRTLGDIVNFRMTQGLKLWLQNDTSVTLTAAQASYTFMPSGSVNMTRPLRVLQGYYLDSSGVSRPLTSLSRDEYTRLGNKTSSGPVNSYFVEKLATQIKVTFWQVPDATAATGTAHVILQTQAATPISLTETLEFPPEWRMALRWGLADEISTGQPQAIMDRCAQRAAFYWTALEDWDVEDADTRMVPDVSAAYPVGAFR